MSAAGSLVRMIRTIGAYTVRSGRWWMPVLLLVWLLAAVLVGTAKVVVPTAVYTIF